MIAVSHVSCCNLQMVINPLNAELNPICHLLALLGGATIVVVSRLRVKKILSQAEPKGVFGGRTRNFEKNVEEKWK